MYARRTTIDRKYIHFAEIYARAGPWISYEINSFTSNTKSKEKKACDRGLQHRRGAETTATTQIESYHTSYYVHYHSWNDSWPDGWRDHCDDNNEYRTG